MLNFRAVVHDWRCAHPAYVPELSDDESFDAPADARQALEWKLGFHGPRKMIVEVEADVYIRSVPLPGGALCHCLGNHRMRPDVFVVLINSMLSPDMQRQVAWQAVLRHVPRRSIGQRSLIDERRILAPVRLDTLAHPRPGWPEFPGWLARVLRRIQGTLDCNQKELGTELEMGQSKFSRRAAAWKEGRRVPEERELEILKSMYLRACCRTLGADSLVHLASSPPEAGSAFSEFSLESLCDALYLSPVATGDGRGHSGVAPKASLDIDLHIRRHHLNARTRTEGFANTLDGGNVFLLLTNDIGLAPPEQCKAVWDRISASIAPREGVEKKRMTTLNKNHMDVVPDEPGRPTWVTQHSGVHRDWKAVMARYAAHHLVNYGDVVQLGSGTSLNALMDAIIERQRTERTGLDLVVLTSNLQVVAKASRATDQPMQIILTGGTLQASLDSLVGEYAARAIATEVFHPRTVFFGAAGLTFRYCRPLSYHFLDEIGAQVSYATRGAEHRVILCDHTKVGKSDAMAADLTIPQLLTNATRCTVITTWPEDDPEAQARLRDEKEALTQSLNALADAPELSNKDFVLEFVTHDGRALPDPVSLSALRKKAAEASA
jgi:DeoR/GlpR family transcriptional regulator of sugar metabolism